MRTPHDSNSPLGPRLVGGAGTADALDLGRMTFGVDLLLTESDDHTLVLHTFDGRRARLLGRYKDAAEAWSAIDPLDTAELNVAA
jgi:hypothetical protein